LSHDSSSVRTSGYAFSTRTTVDHAEVQRHLEQLLLECHPRCASMPEGEARGDHTPAPESSRRWSLSTTQTLATIAAAVVAIVATGVAPGIGWLGKASGLFGDDSQPSETAQQFGERALRGYFTDVGEWYDVLHPAEKALVSRERFLDCERQAGATAGLVSIGKNPSVSNYAISHRGVDETNATSVRFPVTIETRQGTKTTVSAVVMVRHDGEWRRLFFEHEYPEWLAGRCGSFTYPGGKHNPDKAVQPSPNPGSEVLE
jgi:hypothetical protein